MKTIYEVIEASKAADAKKSDYRVPAKELTFPDGKIALPEKYSDGDETAALFLEQGATIFGVNDNALRDLCTKLAPAVYGKGTNRTLPYDYLRAMPTQLMGQNLTDHAQNSNGQRWLVRTFDTSARAVLGTDYPASRNAAGEYENTQFLQVIKTLIEEEPEQFPEIQLVRPYVGADGFHLKIVWRDVFPTTDGDGGAYGLGAYIGNSEIGHGTLTGYGLVQKHSCTNSIIDQRENAFKLLHRGSFAALVKQFKAGIGQLFHASGETLDKLILADTEQIEDFSTVLDGLALQYGWAQPVKNNVLLGTGGRQTRGGLVNGVTYAAHAAFPTDPDKQIEFEILGGDLLFVPADTFPRAANFARQKAAGLVN